MAVGRALKRLLRLRELEEELSRMELETAVLAETRVAETMRDAHQQHAAARRNFLSGIERGDGPERVAGLIAMEMASQARTGLGLRLDEAKAAVALQREEFLARRTGRKQVETLLDEERRAAANQEIHRAQQRMDDWFGGRRTTRRCLHPDLGARADSSDRHANPVPSPESSLGASSDTRHPKG